MDSTGHLCTAAVGAWLLSSVLAFFQKARPLKEGKKGVVSERNSRRISLQTAKATKDELGSHNDHNQSDGKTEPNDKDEISLQATKDELGSHNGHDQRRAAR
jgi:hypothetical protein